MQSPYNLLIPDKQSDITIRFQEAALYGLKPLMNLIILKLLSFSMMSTPLHFVFFIYFWNSIYEQIKNCLKAARHTHLKAENGKLNHTQTKAY